MNAVISNTAEWGEYTTGPKIITPETKERMREALKAIEDGSFAKAWLEESRGGCKTLLRKREELGNHEVEKVGREIRSLFERRMEA
jgi:ketol-acid reductoisomerase